MTDHSTEVRFYSSPRELAISEEFNRQRGIMLGMIESFGLPAAQERGAKSTLKALSYEAEKRLRGIA